MSAGTWLLLALACGLAFLLGWVLGGSLSARSAREDSAEIARKWAFWAEKRALPPLGRGDVRRDLFTWRAASAEGARRAADAIEAGTR